MISTPEFFGDRPDRYAVMGNPVAHSKSPQIHKAFAEQTRQNMIYRALRVTTGGLVRALGDFERQGGKGVNITIPFKEQACGLVDKLAPCADRAGAVNTITFNEDGSRSGDNTDGVGLIRDMVGNQGVEIAGKRILILGAGGAVRGIMQPLLEQHPDSVVICNRTVDKARDLARYFGSSGNVSACGYAALPGAKYDLVINGTSASLNNQLPPLPEDLFSERAWAYDMMYSDRETIFCIWALTHGASHAADGLGMLVEQAAESFFIWRGVRPQTQPVIAMLRSGSV